MGWTFSDRITPPVVKEGGQCMKRSQWKYCPYWKAKHSSVSKTVIGFKCDLFDEDKVGLGSVDACNAQYGLDYDGVP